MSYYYLLLPAVIISLYAQIKVQSTYSKYSKVQASANMTAAQMARRILDANGLRDVRIEPVAGNLTDNYDPRSKVLHLSQSTYSSASVAAIGVAAHECGHAIQDAEDYGPLRIRAALVPIASIGSRASWILLILGLIIGLTPLVDVGIILFSAVVLFYLVTLPVEFNASSRALRVLDSGGYMQQEEVKQTSKVLRAAALTYVAAALTAVLQLLRLLAIANRNRR